jgi:apolipoprotein N-acyltransferase
MEPRSAPNPPPRPRSFRLSRQPIKPGRMLIKAGLLALVIASPWIAAIERGVFLALMVSLPAAFLLLAVRRRLRPGFRPIMAAGIGLFHFAAGAWVAVVFRTNGVDVPDWQLALIAAAGALWLAVAWAARRRKPPQTGPADG